MSYNAYDINVLVNGRRCKQYTHEGKTYIESKDGSKYTLEIKNNTGQRILVVSSVDGLNVLSGESADPADSGYVVDPYSKVEIKGFRYSNDNVGAFEFTRKGDNDSYAASKGDQRNCGVIGLRLFSEIWRPLLQVQKYKLNPDPEPWPIWNTPVAPNPWYDITYGSNMGEKLTSSDTLDYDTLRDSGPTKCAEEVTSKTLGRQSVNYCATSQLKSSDVLREVKSPKFDMATKWGEKLESKVTNVAFERGALVRSVDIYYASRDSLIKMGVPITHHQKVTSPESFPGSYAKPPKGWVG